MLRLQAACGGGGADISIAAGHVIIFCLFLSSIKMGHIFLIQCFPFISPPHVSMDLLIDCCFFLFAMDDAEY